MDEDVAREVAKALLHVSDAGARCGRSAAAVRRSGGPAHVVAALTEAEKALTASHRALSQQAYYAVPDGETARP